MNRFLIRFSGPLALVLVAIWWASIVALAVVLIRMGSDGIADKIGHTAGRVVAAYDEARNEGTNQTASRSALAQAK